MSYVMYSRNIAIKVVFAKVSGLVLFFVTDVSVVLLSNVGTEDGNIQWYLILSRLSSVVGMYHITNGCTEIVS